MALGEWMKEGRLGPFQSCNCRRPVPLAMRYLVGRICDKSPDRQGEDLGFAFTLSLCDLGLVTWPL